MAEEVFWSHVGICVTDLERSVAFYTRVFGFSVDYRGTFEGPELAKVNRLGPPCKFTAALLIKNNFTLEVAQPLEPEPLPFRERPINEPGLIHLNFRTTNIDAMRRRLLENGGTIIEETEMPHETQLAALSDSFYVRDPDGQIIYIMRHGVEKDEWVPPYLR